MNYLREELLESLARRYVAGTMGYRARRRFREVVAEHQEAHDAVLAWEALLVPLALSLKPVQPSDLVWHRIAREIQTSENRPRPIKRSDPLVAAAMVLLTVGLLFTGAGWWQETQKPPEKVVETVVEVVTRPVPDDAIVSVMGVPDQPLWVARIYPNAGKLQIAVNTPPEEQPGKDYELWTLKDDGTPVSLGLLPRSGAKTVELTDRRLAAIAESSMLAVSLEPLGGSPEDVPSGPVLYTAQLLPPQ